MIKTKVAYLGGRLFSKQSCRALWMLFKLLWLAR